MEQLANSDKVSHNVGFVTSDPGAAGDPIQTAKLVASAYQVSNGRFLFGVGGGWNHDEMEDHGTVFESRFKLMRERNRGDQGALDQVQGRISRREVDFPEMMTWPKPMQQPHPPILVGGGFPQAARRVVRYGDVVYVIDPSDYQVAVETPRAEVQNRAADLKV